MTLIDSFKVPCTLMERVRVSDGEGGWVTQWVEGPKFDAAIVLDSSMNARRGEAEGVTGLYTVTTDRNTEMVYHDAFKRDDDGQVFRITKVNDPTPEIATFQFNQYQAEEWELA